MPAGRPKKIKAEGKCPLTALAIVERGKERERRINWINDKLVLTHKNTAECGWEPIAKARTVVEKYKIEKTITISDANRLSKKKESC